MPGQGLNRFLGMVLALGKWLVIPISLLLFMQWPLRSVFKAYSREANDLGQLLFAVYVTLAITAATRAGRHLAADTLARRYGPRTRRLLMHFGNLFALVPWSVFVAVKAAPMIVESLRQLERFPETGNPGYFILRMTLWLLAAGILLAIAVDFRSPPAAQTGPH